MVAKLIKYIVVNEIKPHNSKCMKLLQFDMQIL